MGFAVELYFDPASEARLTQVWHELAGLNLSSFMLEVKARPHVSLAAFEELETKAAEAYLERFARSHLPLELNFASVASFPTELNVVFLAPVVTRTLLDLHDDFYTGWDLSWGTPKPYYHPGNWVPHCTMAMEGPPERVPDIFAALRSSPAFGPVQAASMGLIEFRPVQELCEFRLGPSA